mmetsp:Transcript_35465/g.6390  ORF Transcript_35465/g.6390 Transcript_35465/m.6390 type:complete len:143 (+) Transcript_35465:883-1311(+)
MNIGATKEPPYLQGVIPGREEEEYYSKCLCWNVYPLNMTCSYMFLGRYPNRHEILFWFDFFGPKFMIGMYQAISILLTFWATVIIMYYIQETIEAIEWPGIFLIILSLILWGFISFFLLPEAIRFLTLTSKIEQMKDRNIIE